MTPYQVLGVAPGASLDDIKAAYRQRMMVCHPDKGGSNEEAKLVNAAFEMLAKPRPEPTVVYQRPPVVVRVYTFTGTRTNTTKTGTWYSTW